MDADLPASFRRGSARCIIHPMSKRTDPFTVLVEQDDEGYFVATVPELRGCHTQAKSLDVLMRRVREAIALCLADEPRVPRRFIGVQQVRLA
jgi:predicted RNase H-like HicB family nuclease